MRDARENREKARGGGGGGVGWEVVVRAEEQRVGIYRPYPKYTHKSANPKN